MATSPKTRGAWWLRWALTDGWLAMLQGLAVAGALGEVLRELFAGISEYRRTNYAVLPLGNVPGGDFGQRVAFLQAPRHETSRMLSGMIYKMFSTLGPKEAAGLPVELLDFGAGQFPTLNPALTMTYAWGTLATGHNPPDPFTGRPIVPRTEFNAGLKYQMAPMFRWTMEESGLANFITWDPKSENLFELSVSATPGVNRLIKVSDTGYHERQRSAQELEAALRDRLKLSLGDDVGKLSGEYWSLKGLNPELRTEQQEDRFRALDYWYRSIYMPGLESMAESQENQGARDMAEQRRILREQTQPFERN